MIPVEPKARNRILLLLFSGVLMGALDIAIVGPALPSIQRSFGVDDRAIAWIFTTYVLFNLISVPLMAKLSDVFGRRSIYVLDVGLFAVGSLIVSLSPALPVLLLGRAIQGVGAGGVFPVASAVIGDTFPPEKRGSALGLIGAVFGIAFLVGPLLAGAILAFVSWHWLFLINLPIAAIVIAMSGILPARRPARPRGFDWAGMVILAVLLAALAFGINQLDTRQLAASVAGLNVWPFLLLSVILAPVLAFVERRVSDPVIRISLFGTRQVAVVSLLAAGAGLGEAAVVFVPNLVVSTFGVSSSTASFMLLPAVLAMAVGSPMAGRYLDKVGSRWVVLGGTSLLTAGMFVVAFFGTTLVFFYLAAILVGLGLGILLGAPLRYIMLNEAAVSDRAAAQGILSLASSVGQMVGGALVGAVAASLGGGVNGYAGAFLVVGIASAGLVLLTLFLKSREAEMDTARRGMALNRQDARV